jgi:pimeloyl-ACP methyl ester carboxylesterase
MAMRKLLFAIALIALPLFAQQTELTIAAGAIHGTLLMPQAKAPLPVVLIIAGSGPTDRDGNSPALPGHNNALKMLATGFAANGIASLRYDKRGIAESADAAAKESDLRFETYIDDAVEWCNRLRQDERFSGVIIAGHSEGSLIGMVAAKRCKATGYISLAGAGFPAADILRTQLKGKLPDALAGQSEAILKSLEAGKTVADTPPQLAMLYRASVQPYLISWFKYDPAKEIAALTIPTLIVQGTTDIQVSVDDAKRLAAANPRAKLVIIDGMNHLMKNASGDIQKQLPSYSDPTLPLNEKVIPALVEFVRAATKK